MTRVSRFHHRWALFVWNDKIIYKPETLHSPGQLINIHSLLQSIDCRKCRTRTPAPKHIRDSPKHSRHKRLRRLSVSLRMQAKWAWLLMLTCVKAKPGHKFHRLQQRVLGISSVMIILDNLAKIHANYSPNNVLVPFHPILNGTSYHQFLFLCQPIRIGSIHAVEILQCCWRSELCTPIRFRIVNCADVEVIISILFVFWFNAGEKENEAFKPRLWWRVWKIEFWPNSWFGFVSSCLKRHQMTVTKNERSGDS